MIRKEKLIRKGKKREQEKAGRPESGQDQKDGDLYLPSDPDFMYISAHAQLEEERAQALQAETLETGNAAQAGLAAGQEENGEQVMEQEKGDGKAEGQEGLILNPEDMWCLILTNAQYPIPEDYLPVLKEVPGQGQSVDERIYDPLMEMLSDEGAGIVTCCLFRLPDSG